GVGAGLDPAQPRLEQRGREVLGVATLAGAGRSGEEIGVAGVGQRGGQQRLRLGLRRQALERGVHRFVASRTRARTARGGPDASTTWMRSGNRAAAAAKPSATAAWKPSLSDSMRSGVSPRRAAASSG